MDIDVFELKKKLDASEDFTLIDVRESYEHAEFNLGGTLIPLGDLPASIANLNDAKDDEVVVYCRSGKRSAMAQRLLQQAGFGNVRNLEGGVLAWIGAHESK
ncbi:MAG: rhodanese-like domain-containing protein [Saprospiraceae bacterium]|nr:rhodanese-like domain-containing protein [Saprospiraceae bacterium]